MSSTKRPQTIQPASASMAPPTKTTGKAFLQSRQALVIGCSLLLLWVSIAHSLEDFVYGIPARFGLSVATAALLLGVGYVVQVTGILLSPFEAPLLWNGMLAHAIPIVVVTMLVGLGAAASLFFRHYRVARILVVIETGFFM